ncbi:DinB family protein [Gynurincola endophyticus]|jgi:hypothetical protein|uniref:DinB family protein n=1 Tax=Gynurincola endophyticus TaxID=2479004 RepID=UPI000F8E9BA9|nr:DinB family protein [Gynurincola endophyticus]
MDKIEFLKKELIFHLKHVAPNEHGKWGKMTGQHMVEHLIDVFKMANGKLVIKSTLPPEIIERNYKFLQSDIPFKENTKNPLLPELPLPLRFQTIQQAVEALQIEVNDFFEAYTNQPDLILPNPVFGELNYQDQLQLLVKHCSHHLRQFGLIS